MDKKEALERIKEAGGDLENLPDEYKKDRESLYIVKFYILLYYLNIILLSYLL